VLLVTTALLVLSLVPIVGTAQDRSSWRLDPPIQCERCDAWNRPVEPYRVFGNTYYVGVAGLSAILITSDDGHILVDGGLPQSAPVIAENIRAVGFRPEDVRIIAASHEHSDHVGGIAALQRLTRATVAASVMAARALSQGEPTREDPQAAFGRETTGFPRVKHVRVVQDGETLRVGTLAITAHLTPGHTPGSTTWTWRSCEAERCLDVVYADSLTSVSAPAFRFADVPRRVERFRRSIATVGKLPCDILLSVHPDFADLGRKRAAQTSDRSRNPFVDSTACRTYAENAARSLERRLGEER
jgi:metallo-beta-lactamase class B